MDDFPNNSQRAKEEPLEVDEPQIHKIIEGTATVRKPSGLRRFRRSFIAGDASTVGEHVFWQLLIPELQNVFLNMGNTFLEMMVLGDKRTFIPNQHGPIKGPGQSNSKISYNSVSTPGSQLVIQPSQAQAERYDPNEIYLQSRAEAAGVIQAMKQTVAKFGLISISTMYGMLGVSTKEYTDTRWGWKNLDTADFKRIGGQYLLVLPPPEDLS